MLRFVLAALAALWLASTAAAEPIRLTRITHIYGIVPDPADASRVLLATDRGFFTAGPDGNAEQVSVGAEPIMAFAAPQAGPIFLATAPQRGVLLTGDRGRTWAPLPPAGAVQPGPFLVLEIAPTDALTVFGVANGVVYRSGDGGRSWSELGPAPAPVVDLAVSAALKDVVYLGTARGLFRSIDGGRSWTLLPIDGASRPASLTITAPDGMTYAFLGGIGLVRLAANGQGWEVLSGADAFDGALLHMAIRADTGRAYAVTQFMKILVSDDRGRTWKPFNPP